MHLEETITPPLWQIELQVCDIVSQQSGIPRNEVTIDSRLIEDLHIDSLDLVELIFALEDELQVTIPDDLGKCVFIESPLRVGTLAKLIQHQWGTGKPLRPAGLFSEGGSADHRYAYFSQIGGRASYKEWTNGCLYEPLTPGETGLQQFRRTTDGMRCVLIPAATVEIGHDASGQPDQTPSHRVSLTSFIMDAEPISVVAFCRFLNSAEAITPDEATEFYGVHEDDRRKQHVQIQHSGKSFLPQPGTERQPVVLVSYYGAAAYSAWANRANWKEHTDGSFLPTEAQWEYSARGESYQDYPWGEDEPTSEHAWVGLHTARQTYPARLPLADVNASLGVSPFGLHHMSGNVWHWCRDWYDPGFYRTPEATLPNPVNQHRTGIMAERGGSWVGPGYLAKASYRRGRPPYARGRCLGFRCIGKVEELRHG